MNLFKFKIRQREKPKQKFDEDKMYECSKCGYTQGVSWDGKMRPCKGCGSFDWKDSG